MAPSKPTNGFRIDKEIDGSLDGIVYFPDVRST